MPTISHRKKMKLYKIENEKKERKQEREKLKIKQSFLRDMSLETQIPTFPHTVKFSFCCALFLRIKKYLLPLSTVDMGDDVVTEAPVFITSALDDLVITGVDEIEASACRIQHIKNNTSARR